MRHFVVWDVLVVPATTPTLDMLDTIVGLSNVCIEDLWLLYAKTAFFFAPYDEEDLPWFEFEKSMRFPALIVGPDREQNDAVFQAISKHYPYAFLKNVYGKTHIRKDDLVTHLNYEVSQIDRFQQNLRLAERANCVFVSSKCHDIHTYIRRFRWKEFLRDAKGYHNVLWFDDYIVISAWPTYSVFRPQC